MSTLVNTLIRFRWKSPNDTIYKAALSAIENISSIRKTSHGRPKSKPGSRGDKLRKLEHSIATLDAAQARAVIETVDDVQRIRGLAGSGKTIVLALKAAYLHTQHPEWRIAVTFNTRSLKGHFRRLITRFALGEANKEPDWQNLRIVNAWGAPGSDERDGIYFEFCRTHNLEYFDFRTARGEFRGREFDGVCRHALAQMRQLNTRTPRYDAILVDEAQDFSDSFLQICYELLNDPRRLVYAYDELQNLGGETMSAPETLFGKDANGRPRVRFNVNSGTQSVRDLILPRCYRTPGPVLATAHALGFGIYRTAKKNGDTGLVQMFDSPHLWHEIGYNVLDGSLEEGALVTLHRTKSSSPEFLENHSPLDDLMQFIQVDSKEQQGHYVADAIAKNLKEDDLTHDDIVVINPDPFTTRKEVGPIISRLIDLGIKSHVAGVDTRPDVFFRDNLASVTFTGIHRAKGNEAGMVYIINAQDCSGAPRNLASIRNRLFVAMTRSKAWVRVVGVGEGMQDLKAEYEELKGRGFELQFKYPTENERKNLRLIHRDMTPAERKSLQRRKVDLKNIVEGLDSGRFHVEDLDQSILARLKNHLEQM